MVWGVFQDWVWLLARSPLAGHPHPPSPSSSFTFSAFVSSSGTHGLIRLPSKCCCEGDICWVDVKTLAWCPAQSKPWYPLPTFRWFHQSCWFRENSADQELPLLWLFLINGSSHFLILHWNPVSEFPACHFYFFFLDVDHFKNLSWICYNIASVVYVLVF